MKNLTEAIQQKEAEILRLQEDLQVLRAAQAILENAVPASPSPVTSVPGPVSVPHPESRIAGVLVPNDEHPQAKRAFLP